MASALQAGQCFQTNRPPSSTAQADPAGLSHSKGRPPQITSKDGIWCLGQPREGRERSRSVHPQVPSRPLRSEKAVVLEAETWLSLGL